MSRITQVTYRRTCNTGNFDNFVIEAMATVEEGEHPRHVSMVVQSYVDTLCQERIDARQRGVRGGHDVGEVPEL